MSPVVLLSKWPNVGATLKCHGEPLISISTGSRSWETIRYPLVELNTVSAKKSERDGRLGSSPARNKTSYLVCHDQYTFTDGNKKELTLLAYARPACPLSARNPVSVQASRIRFPSLFPLEHQSGPR